MLKLNLLLGLFFVGITNICAQDTMVVATKNVASKYDCFLPKASDKIFIVKSLADSRANFKMCNNIFADDSLDLDVDFLNYNLLFYTFKAELGSEFSYQLYKIPAQKKYLFVLKIKRAQAETNKANGKVVMDLRGNTKTRRIIELTPNLEPNYTVEFKKLETFTLPLPEQKQGK